MGKRECGGEGWPQHSDACGRQRVPFGSVSGGGGGGGRGGGGGGGGGKQVVHKAITVQTGIPLSCNKDVNNRKIFSETY